MDERRWGRQASTGFDRLRQAQPAFREHNQLLLNREGEVEFSFFYHHLPRDGYGYGGIKIVKALGRLGASVRERDMCRGGRQVPAGERKWRAEGNAMALCVPEWWRDIETRGRFFGMTMFESTRMPQERVRLINENAAVCVVPSLFCAEMFEAQGVTVPIEVVRWGIDPEDYSYMDRRDHTGPYTFLWSGTPDMRKGWDLVYRAFWAAFGKISDAQLTMHFRSLPRGVTGTMDANVKLVDGFIELGEWRGLLREADCFVFPSRGEGWGLPPREAAATGLPVLATDWGGLHEEIVCWARPLRVKELRRAAFGGWDEGEVGEWAEPDFDHLVHLMRDCFENRDREAGRAAASASWMTVMATWKRTAEGLMRVMGD